MGHIKIDGTFDNADYQIYELAFKIDNRFVCLEKSPPAWKVIYAMSVWNGSEWIPLKKFIKGAQPNKNYLYRAGKEVLGQILSIDYNKVYPYIPLYDHLEGEKYRAGDVVYDSGHNAVGVVLGCIDDKRGELRLDSDGMVSQECLRFATLEDIEREGVLIGKGLYEHIKNIHLPFI